VGREPVDIEPSTAVVRSPVRPHSIAELVASQLRERIIVGELRDGDVLPKQEDHLVEFGVSKPSLREALRILETEGLVRVRRGKVGGAIVQRPRVGITAQGIEMALRSKGVGLDEVADALRRLEPVCAGLCAARTDRRKTVLPRLRAAHEKAAEAVDDIQRYTRFARRFHEEMVACCGNETIIFVLSALETICSEDSEAWAREVAPRPGRRSDPIAKPAYRHQGIDDHTRIIELIEAGDVDGAEAAARQHAVGRQRRSPGR
jgi:DNA-binding FadR family transcriptional regulator